MLYGIRFDKNRQSQMLKQVVLLPSSMNMILSQVIKMLSDQLKQLKEERKLTNQQLSDLSGVPLGTINRILSGQTDNPSFQTICDIIIAMDGSLDELAGIEAEPETPSRSKAPGREIIELYQEIITNKDKWIHRLFICCCFLTLVLVAIVGYDLTHPTVGFFQGP